MIYGIFGPRDVRGEPYTDRDYIAKNLESLPDLTGIIVGGGRGVEALIKDWAESKPGIGCRVAPPNLGIQGVTTGDAFNLRNMEILHGCDRAAVFWDGVLPHTMPLIISAIILKKPITVFPL